MKSEPGCQGKGEEGNAGSLKRNPKVTQRPSTDGDTDSSLTIFNSWGTTKHQVRQKKDIPRGEGGRRLIFKKLERGAITDTVPEGKSDLS